jgi:hypothetical protein
MSRHLFILTTNTLDVNPNLIGRTGRIRYLINFKNIPEEIVKEYINDNLKKEYEDLKPQIIEKINLLEYNSIDLLKSLIEEVNITGVVDSPDEEIMNIPLCRYSWEIMTFENADWGDAREIRKFIVEHNPKGLPILEWLKSDWVEDGSTPNNSIGDKATSPRPIEEASEPTAVKEEEKVTNEDKLDDIFPNIYFYRRRVTSRFSHIWKDTDLSVGTVVTEPDKDGIFSYLDQYSKDENIAVVLKQKTNIGLYNKGIL